MNSYTARTARAIDRLRSGRMGRRRRVRSRPAQSDPDRERQSRVDRLAPDHSRAARRRDHELGWQSRRGIEAYASHTSVKAGETLDVQSARIR